MSLDITRIPFGEKRKMQLKITEEKRIPMEVIRGKQPGKTLVVTAGMHGCEYVGIEAARRLSENLDAEKIRGTLLLLPLLNPQGFLQGVKQLMPEDGKNLNRVFPGDIEGTYAQRLAAVIEERIYPQADFLLDLHGGDINESLTPLLFFPNAAGASVREEALFVARRLSLPILVASSSKNGLYSRAAQKGLPALLLERGCAGRWTKDEVNQMIEDVRRAMSALDMLDENYEPCGQIQIENAVYEESPADGMWYPAIEAGETVSEGQLLGQLRDMEGRLLKSFHAECGGRVLYYTMSLGVQKGDPLAAYGWE